MFPISSVKRTALLAFASLTLFGAAAFADPIVVGGFPAYPGYPQTDAIDTGANKYATDYASLGGNTATFLQFAFSVPKTFSSVLVTDRTSSGGANGSFVLGTYDYTTSFTLNFYSDAAFTNLVGSVTGTRATPGPGVNTLPFSAFQTLVNVPNVTAQYVQYQVNQVNPNSPYGGQNPGLADITFNVVPEPSALFLMGTVALFVTYKVRKRAALNV